MEMIHARGYIQLQILTKAGNLPSGSSSGRVSRSFPAFPLSLCKVDAGGFHQLIPLKPLNRHQMQEDPQSDSRQRRISCQGRTPAASSLGRWSTSRPAREWTPPIWPSSWMAWTSMSTAWTSSPLTRASKSLLCAHNAAFPPLLPASNVTVLL